MSALTGYAAAARHLLLRLSFHRLEWRHHGLGMLQGELSEDLRVHLFHPMLRTIPKEGKRDVHDHRFTITSYIAYGSITDVPHSVYLEKDWIGTPPEVEAFRGRNWTKEDAWEIKHSKVQDGNDCTPLGRAWVLRHEEMPRAKGEVYTIPRREWHTTIVNEFAITLVNRSEFDEGPARILGGCHSAINRSTPKETIGYVVDCAIGAQRRLFEH